jgi:hypothetical protein
VTPDIQPAAPHTPTRPSWLCGADGSEWPCEEARSALLAEYANDRTALGVFLTGLLYDAAWDLKGTPAEDRDALFRRFVRWALLPMPTI